MNLAEQFVKELSTIPYDEEISDYLDNFKFFQEAKIVDEEVVTKSRWYERVRNCLVFTDGSFAAYEENVGLTEMQEGTEPYVSCYLIEPYEETVVKYRKV